jgi:hypothetical protein
MTRDAFLPRLAAEAAPGMVYEKGPRRWLANQATQRTTRLVWW